MAVFTLDMENPSGIFFPSYCELETYTHFKFALSQIHVRRMNHAFEVLALLPIH